MKLKKLRYFEENETGRIPWDVLTQLELPMPDDVLSQFVFDHGTKEEFLNAYGELDLHSITWCLDSVSVECFFDAVAKNDSSQEYVESVTHEMSNGLSIWEKSHNPYVQKNANHWKSHKTWSCAPIYFIHPDVSEGSFHLVEGHTRTGALIGLYNHDASSVLNEHQVWVGRPATETAPDPSNIVLKDHHKSFDAWLTRWGWSLPSRHPLSRAMSNFHSIEGAMRYLPSKGGFTPNTYEDVESRLSCCIEGDSFYTSHYSRDGLAELKAELPKLHDEWQKDIKRWLAE